MNIMMMKTHGIYTCPTVATSSFRIPVYTNMETLVRYDGDDKINLFEYTILNVSTFSTANKLNECVIYVDIDNPVNQDGSINAIGNFRISTSSPNNPENKITTALTFEKAQQQNITTMTSTANTDITCTVNDASIFNVGDIVKISEVLDNATTDALTLDGVYNIKSISGNVLTFKEQKTSTVTYSSGGFIRRVFNRDGKNVENSSYFSSPYELLIPANDDLLTALTSTRIKIKEFTP